MLSPRSCSNFSPPRLTARVSARLSAWLKKAGTVTTASLIGWPGKITYPFLESPQPCCCQSYAGSIKKPVKGLRLFKWGSHSLIICTSFFGNVCEMTMPILHAIGIDAHSIQKLTYVLLSAVLCCNVATYVLKIRLKLQRQNNFLL